MYIAMQLSPYSWLFFVSFVVVATFVVINLFIAVVINNLEAAKQERLAHQGETTLDNAQRELKATQESLAKLAGQLDRMQRKEY